MKISILFALMITLSFGSLAQERSTSNDLCTKIFTPIRHSSVSIASKSIDFIRMIKYSDGNLLARDISEACYNLGAIKTQLLRLVHYWNVFEEELKSCIVENGDEDLFKSLNREIHYSLGKKYRQLDENSSALCSSNQIKYAKEINNLLGKLHKEIVPFFLD